VERPAKSGGISRFPGYAFVRLVYWAGGTAPGARTEGVVIFVGTSGQGIAIPEKQIEHVQTLLASKFPSKLSLSQAGQRVRIRGGALMERKEYWVAAGLRIACW